MGGCIIPKVPAQIEKVVLVISIFHNQWLLQRKHHAFSNAPKLAVIQYIRTQSIQEDIQLYQTRYWMFTVEQQYGVYVLWQPFNSQKKYAQVFQHKSSRLQSLFLKTREKFNDETMRSIQYKELISIESKIKQCFQCQFQDTIQLNQWNLPHPTNPVNII
jgi:hypothetical protein